MPRFERRPSAPASACAVVLGALFVAACGAGPAEPTKFSGAFAVSRVPFSVMGLGDCNGDGRLDVFAASPQGFGLRVRASDGSLPPPTPMLTELLSRAPQGPSANLVIADVDGDGNADLVAGFDAVYLARGHGDCTFDPPVAISAPRSCRFGQLAVTDVDLDGVADVAFTCAQTLDAPLPDPRAPVGLLLGRGDGTFTELVAPAPPPPPFHYSPFGTFFADLDGDGARDYVAMIDHGESWMSWGDAGDLPAFTDHDDALTTFLAKGDPMSIAPLDFDRDGRMDLFVSVLDEQPMLVSFSGRHYRNRAGDAFLALADLPSGGELWGAYAFDADLDGWTDLLVLRSTVDGRDAPAVFFHNDRDGAFTHWTNDDVLPLATATRELVCGDLMSTGATSCYVAAEQDALPSYVVEDRLKPAGKWVGLRLVGTVSSPEAEGATVSLTGATPPLVRYYGAQSPTFEQHDRGLVLAVGAADEASVDIAWPSGLEQHVDGLVAGTYATIREPPVVKLSARVVPADGASTVDVKVTPSRSGWDGAVSIEREGAGDWAGDVEEHDGDWTRTLVAPDAPGDARIDVRIGEHQLLVRPRVTFSGE